MASRILVVDDEPTVTEVVERYLVREGYEVASTADGADGLRLAREWPPNLIVLDLMLPSIDGLEVCRQLRRETQVPIIMLTARGEETDRVVGLEMGADDYMVKPFSPRELVARVKAVLRRVDAAPVQLSGDAISFGGMVIDPQGRKVTVGGDEVNLTAKEFDLLRFLAANHGQVFSRSQLMDQVWDFTFAADASTVTVHIRRRREKVEVNPERPRFIKTVRGVATSLKGRRHETGLARDIRGLGYVGGTNRTVAAAHSSVAQTTPK